jgi:hypothetical protein
VEDVAGSGGNHHGRRVSSFALWKGFDFGFGWLHHHHDRRCADVTVRLRRILDVEASWLRHHDSQTEALAQRRVLPRHRTMPTQNQNAIGNLGRR